MYGRCPVLTQIAYDKVIVLLSVITRTHVNVNALDDVFSCRLLNDQVQFKVVLGLVRLVYRCRCCKYLCTVVIITQVYSVISKEDGGIDISYTNSGLPLHVDQSYAQFPLGIMVLHCLR